MDKMRETFESARIGSSGFIFHNGEYISRSIPRDTVKEMQMNEDWYMWQAAWKASREALQEGK